MSPLTTHVLDVRLGRPAARISVVLERSDSGAWKPIAGGAANDDGRIADLLNPGELSPGVYRLVFDTAAYFEKQQVEHFYPQVTVEFQVSDATRHYHVPLLLAPFGYSTYRGS